MTKRKYWALLIAIATLLPGRAWSRWATLEDAEYELEFDNYTETVHADATSDVVSEIQFKLLKDGARLKIGTFPIVYNSGFESVQVLEAKTIYHGNVYPVPAKDIEDKPLASNTLGFDRLNQILVAFPHLEIGAQIYLKTLRKTRATPIEGFYSSRYSYGAQGYEGTGKVHIDSAIPVFVQANDPEGKLKITQKRRGARYIVDIQQLSPAYYEPLEEPGSFVDIHRIPWVEIASRKQWSEMGQPLVAKYEKVLHQPLPAVFEDIAREAAKKQGFVDRVNTVTSQLESIITYKGDWKTIAGRYVPRNLKEIADSGLGDCKDFAASTTAILRRLGLDAHMALVHRGMREQEADEELPSVQAFNHAIVYVRDGQRDYWIDPTNSTSFAQGLYADISNRRALVLDGDRATLLHVPALKPEDSQAKMSKFTDFLASDGETAQVDGNLMLTGNLAVPMTGALLRNSRKVLDYALIRMFGDEKNIEGWKFDDYDLTSREVNDLAFHVEFREHNSSLVTSAGTAYLLPEIGENVLVKTDGRVSDLYVGLPHLVERETRLENVSRIGDRDLNCTIDAPWVAAERKVVSDGKGVTVNDRIEFKKEIISNSELQSEAYSTMRQRMENCLENVALVYSTGRSGVRGPAGDSSSSPAWWQDRRQWSY